jgi:hypothetical protein
MGVHAELRDERGVRKTGLPDPSGGLFDAPGDFDRIVPLDCGAGRAGYRLLHYVDPYGDTVFNVAQMADLLEDVALALTRTSNSIEQRGLHRLRAIAERCRDGTHMYVWFIGD